MKQSSDIAGRPLEGIRVLDLTSAWAGPMAGGILAALGAEVIHVEGPNRMDGWRGTQQGGHPSLYPDRNPGEHPYNRSCMFNSQNLGKLSLVVDLKAQGMVQVVRRVAMSCNLVLSNFTPGTLDRLGLGYRDLRPLKPDIIVVQMPAFGNSGPLANYGALGPTMELGAGMASLVGYGDGEPIATGPAYMDPIGAYNAAAACLTAIVCWQATGMGQEVEVAQCEAGMQWIGEEILHAAEAGSDRVPEGNHVTWAAPHDCFQCRGDDQWVAIAATSDEEWHRLCVSMKREDLLCDERFSTLPRRLYHQEELNHEISSWTQEKDKEWIADRLQGEGVPAAPVMNGRDVAESEYLDRRGFFVELDHPEVGRQRYQGLPFHFERSASKPTEAAPCFGQHTAEVLSRLAGLSEVEIRELAEAKAIVVAEPVTAEASS